MWAQRSPIFSLYFRTASRHFVKDQQVRVRFAPSPTGDLHLGGLRTAFYNFLFAKQQNGKFLIRIENTDTERTVEGCVDRIKADCKWIGIEAEEPIIYQSDRLDRYKECAHQLIADNHAYYCFCTPERLEQMREVAKAKGKNSFYDRKCSHLTEKQIQENLDRSQPFVIRMNVPRHEQVIVNDLVHGDIRYNCDTIDDQIILKSDGFPTYHLASVVDDHDQQITHVMRGDEWIPSIPKHLLLYRYFKWTPPRFAHLPLLLNPDKSKLSKRQKASALQWYRDQGFEKEAIICYLSTLGWAPKIDFSRDDYFPTVQNLIELFSFRDVLKSGAIVDIDKMYFINSRYLNYLAKTNPKQLVSLARPIIENHIGSENLERYSEEYIEKVLLLTTSRMRIVNEFVRICYFFVEPDYDSDIAKEMKTKIWDDKSAAILEDITTRLSSVPEEQFENCDQISAQLAACCAQFNIKMGKLYPICRYALTASHIGAAIPETIATLGKQITLTRLQNNIHQ